MHKDLSNLLQAKLIIPKLREKIIERPRLYQKLEGIRIKKLTAICAPAGYGKSTLITAWLNQSQVRAAWLSLDETENDPVTFLAYIIEAIGKVEPLIQQRGATSQLFSMSVSLHVGITNLINLLTDLKQPLLLVLDDYHVITNPEVHRELEFFVKHLPPHLHLVLLSREQIPFPTTYLRAQNQLVEISSEDLKFNQDESAKFLNFTMALDLSDEEISEINQRYEGWIVGLQLAGLSLQSESKSRRNTVMKTDHLADVTEYLVQEIFKNQPPEIQRFLIITSILNWFTPELCSAMADDSNAISSLAYLQSTNLFLIPLEGDKHSFRYHHLFSDILRKLLPGMLSKEEIEKLHLKACQWYFDRGYSEEAINHAITGGNYDLAASVVDTTAAEIWGSGRVATLRRWISSFPENVLEKHPKTRLEFIWLLFLKGSHVEAREALAALSEDDSLLLPEDQQAVFLGRYHMIKSTVASGGWDMKETGIEAQKALDILPEEAWLWRAMAHLAYGGVYEGGPAHEKALVHYQKAVFYCRDHSSGIGIFLVSLTFLMNCLIFNGKLNEANHQFEELNLYYNQFEVSFNNIGIIYLLHAVAQKLQGNSANFEKEIDSGLNIIRGEMDTEWLLEGTYFKGAYADTPAARNAALKELQTVFQKSHRKELVKKLFDAFAARLYVLSDNYREAAPLVSSFNLTDVAQYHLKENSQDRIMFYDTTCPQSYTISFNRITALRWWIGMGKEKLAYQYYDEWRLEVQESVYKLQELEFCILGCHLAWVNGERKKATDHLLSAVRLAQENFILYPFVADFDLLQPVFEHLTYVPKTQMPQSTLLFLKKVMQKGGSTSDCILTNREIELLKLVSDGYSNAEIEENLVITKNTVRTHLKNIYRKLGVQNRMQAVVCAKEQNLI